jgi:hypothetical protein
VNVEQHVVARDPAQLLQGLPQRGDVRLRFRHAFGCIHENANAPHPLSLLCPRRERPCRCRASENRYEITTVHSISASARSSKVGGET